MENKPQSVFEKLDKQEEKIEDISSKLEGISIEDLYALAKRTWDYEDYQTAQKYYNHISLLRPLDWEAPLYASLCNFRGLHKVDFWEYGLNQASKVLVSTINYINNLNKLIDEKEKEMTKCVEIIKDNMLIIKDMYFKNKDAFDNYIPDFVCKIESFYLDVYNKTMTIELDSLNVLRLFIAENILDLIKNTKKLSSDISKESLDKLISLTKKDYSFDFKIIKELNSTKPINKLSIEEKNEIMLNGVMYFEYNDKIISKRNYKRNIFMGIILISLGIIGIIVSLLGKWYWAFTFISSLICGILLVIKALTQKERIKCSSLLFNNRLKNRLTSDGKITQDRKYSFMILLAYIGLYLVILVGVFMAIFALQEKEVLTYAIIFVIIDALNIISYVISLKGLNDYPTFRNGKYIYLYKGKYYNIE